ncbi:MAG: molecular chaperone DnaJ, partial [Malacoplasma sp.]|nr:molecular chaperone DnaJ [Malacoplasma sp.]
NMKCDNIKFIEEYNLTMSSRDYYEILGVSKDATEDQIKSAFRKKAMQYHPDRNKEPGAEEKFKEVNQAYEVLSDPQKRRNYDQFGPEGVEGSFGGAGFNPFDIFNQFFGGSGRSGGVHFEDSFDGGFEDIFTSFFTGSSRRSGFSRQKETNLIISISLTFVESIVGVKKTIEYKIEKDCKTCGGTGSDNSENSIITCSKCNGSGVEITQKRTIMGIIQSQNVCSKCHGEGKEILKKCVTCKGRKVEEERVEIDVEIPGGVTNDEHLKVSGKGSIINGKTGDLYINIKVHPSKIFSRKGNDIYVILKVDPILAIVGGEATIPSPYGMKSIKLKPGTKNGDIITVPSHGVKTSKRFGSNGDLFAVVEYTSPKKFNQADLKILSKFAQETNEEIEKYLKEARKEMG